MNYDSLETMGLTKMIKKKFGYKWVIENFKDFLQKPGQSIISSNFSSDLNKEDVWYIRLFPNGETKENEGYLSIFLTLVSTKKGVENVMCHFSIVDFENSAKIKTMPTSRNLKLEEGYTDWGWHRFVKRDVLFEKASKILPNGTLTINCYVEKMDEIITTTKITRIPMPIEIPNSTLADDLSLAVQNEKFSDILLKIGKSEFRASKVILAARSPVFSGMFSHGTMKENQKNQVDIADVDENVFQELLYFIYTDKAPNINEMPEELLAAADKYQLDRLKIMCEKALYEKISIDNVVEIFVLSEMYNAEKLKDGTLKFMKGREIELLKTDGYKSLQESNNLQALKLCEMLLIGEHMLTLEISSTK